MMAGARAVLMLYKCRDDKHTHTHKQTYDGGHFLQNMSCITDTYIHTHTYAHIHEDVVTTDTNSANLAQGCA